MRGRMRHLLARLQYEPRLLDAVSVGAMCLVTMALLFALTWALK